MPAGHRYSGAPLPKELYCQSGGPLSGKNMPAARRSQNRKSQRLAALQKTQSQRGTAIEKCQRATAIAAHR